MIIRKFQKSDQQQVSQLISSIMAEEFPFERSAYTDTDLKDIEGAYGGKRDAFYVSELDDRVIGTVAIKEDSPECALMRRLFLSKDYRGKGYGRKLLEEATVFCQNSGYKSIAFRATNRMSGAINLCRKNKFSESERIDLGGIQIYKYIYQL